MSKNAQRYGHPPQDVQMLALLFVEQVQELDHLARMLDITRAERDSLVTEVIRLECSLQNQRDLTARQSATLLAHGITTVVPYVCN